MRHEDRGAYSYKKNGGSEGRGAFSNPKKSGAFTDQNRDKTSSLFSQPSNPFSNTRSNAFSAESDPTYSCRTTDQVADPFCNPARNLSIVNDLSSCSANRESVIMFAPTRNRNAESLVSCPVKYRRQDSMPHENTCFSDHGYVRRNKVIHYYCVLKLLFIVGRTKN